MMKKERIFERWGKKERKKFLNDGERKKERIFE